MVFRVRKTCSSSNVFTKIDDVLQNYQCLYNQLLLDMVVSLIQSIESFPYGCHFASFLFGTELLK